MRLPSARTLRGFRQSSFCQLDQAAAAECWQSQLDNAQRPSLPRSGTIPTTVKSGTHVMHTTWVCRSLLSTPDNPSAGAGFIYESELQLLLLAEPKEGEVLHGYSGYPLVVQATALIDRRAGLGCPLCESIRLQFLRFAASHVLEHSQHPHRRRRLCARHDRTTALRESQSRGHLRLGPTLHFRQAKLAVHGACRSSVCAV